MRYQIGRHWDATMFGPGLGKAGCIERDEQITQGYVVVPLPEDFTDDLQRELLSGTVQAVVRASECQDVQGADFRIWLREEVDVADLARRHGKTEDEILDVYLGLGSEAAAQVKARNRGKPVLLDDIYHTIDRGEVGVIWFFGGELMLYGVPTGSEYERTHTAPGVQGHMELRRRFLMTVPGRSMDLSLTYEDLRRALWPLLGSE